MSNMNRISLALQEHFDYGGDLPTAHNILEGFGVPEEDRLSMIVGFMETWHGNTKRFANQLEEAKEQMHMHTTEVNNRTGIWLGHMVSRAVLEDNDEE